MLLGFWGVEGEAPCSNPQTHVPRMDILSLMVLTEATGNSPVKKLLGTTCPTAKPHTSRPHSDASRGSSPGKRSLPSTPSSGEQEKPLPLPPVHELACLCTLSSWGASVHPSVRPSIHPSIHPSICPGNGLNSPCPTP